MLATLIEAREMLLDNSIPQKVIDQHMEGLNARQGWRKWNKDNPNPISFKFFRRILKQWPPQR